MDAKHFPGASVVLIGLCIVSLLPAQHVDSGSFARFRIAASGVPGWTEQKEQYRSFTAEELYGIIDGGAAKHQKQGLKHGIGLSLSNGTKTLGIYFEDFGTSSRARGMVRIKKNSCSDPKNMTVVKDAAAMYDEVIGGCIVYWAKSRYYIEMTLTGYDSTNNAVRDAGIFIGCLGRFERQ
jgi:hypothetical protein